MIAVTCTGVGRIVMVKLALVSEPSNAARVTGPRIPAGTPWFINIASPLVGRMAPGCVNDHESAGLDATLMTLPFDRTTVVAKVTCCHIPVDAICARVVVEKASDP